MGATCKMGGGELSMEKEELSVGGGGRVNKVVIDNHDLTQVNSAKYFGVIIEHKVNWIEPISHINSIVYFYFKGK